MSFVISANSFKRTSSSITLAFDPATTNSADGVCPIHLRVDERVLARLMSCEGGVVLQPQRLDGGIVGPRHRTSELQDNFHRSQGGFAVALLRVDGWPATGGNSVTDRAPVMCARPEIGAYSFFMRRYAQKLTPLLWVVALALIGVRTSGAHLHLCFDGQEPRSSLHLADSEATCHDRAVPQGSPHEDDDVDVDALGAAVAKKGADTDPVYPIAVAAVVFSLSPRVVVVVDELTAPSLAPRRPYLFLPLLRGPPV